MLKKGWRFENTNDYLTVEVDDLEEIINLCYSIIEEDKGSTRFVSADKFISTMKYLAGKNNKVKIQQPKSQRFFMFSKKSVRQSDQYAPLPRISAMPVGQQCVMM